MLKLPPNTLLQESHLAKNFDVSRTPVRQALTKLEENDFVSFMPNRGYIIKDVDFSEFRDISMLRSAVECVAAQQAAVRATDEQLLILENVLENMKSSQWTHSSAENSNMFVSLESEFHSNMCKISQNSYLIDQYNTIVPKLQHLRYFFSYKYNTNTDSRIMLSMYEEHLIIYLAIKSRNPTLAYEAVRQHVNRLLKGIPEETRPT